MLNRQALAEIKAYIQQWGGRYHEWYAGVASDPKERLFSGHSVKEKGDGWIYRWCDSSAGARSVEDALLRLGTKGGPGGGDYTSTAVYAYKIASHTVE